MTWELVSRMEVEKKKTSTQSDRVMLGPGIPFKRLKVMNLRKAGISRSKQDIIYN